MAQALPDVGQTWRDKDGNRWFVSRVNAPGRAPCIELHLTFAADPGRHAVLVMAPAEFYEFALLARLRTDSAARAHKPLQAPSPSVV